jgi:hypothetical protein
MKNNNKPVIMTMWKDNEKDEMKQTNGESEMA